MQRFLSAAYWLVLILWISSLVAAGATAMAAFSTLPRIGVAMPEAAVVYPGADAASGRFAAGFVAQPVFTFAERVELFAAPVMAVLLLLQRSLLRWPGRSWANRLRVACLLGAIALAFGHLWFLAPRMRVSLADYRAAVFEGDVEAAREHRVAFERDHTRADPVFRITLGLLAGAALLSGWTMTPRRSGRSDSPTPRAVLSR